jgi:hypothetical protein
MFRRIAFASRQSPSTGTSRRLYRASAYRDGSIRTAGRRRWFSDLPLRSALPAAFTGRTLNPQFTSADL